MYIYIVIGYLYCYFGGVLSSHPGILVFTTLYGSNIPSKPLSYRGIHGFNESRSFIHNYIR